MKAPPNPEKVTRDNHFVPQWYLKPWANEAGLVWTYRLLVPHESIPRWQKRHPRGVAFRRDLYTSVDSGIESDEFERWLEQKMETPARAIVQKVLSGQDLHAHEWQVLGRYALCQQLRTPQDFEESMERWRRMFPDVVESNVKKALQVARECEEADQPLPTYSTRGVEHLKDIFKIEVRPDARPETNEGEIRVSVVLGRELWLKQQRHLLENIGWFPAMHNWAIAEPAGPAVWFTSDQPVVRLNYGDKGLDLRGGWGRPKGNIFMPLSPRHLQSSPVMWCKS